MKTNLIFAAVTFLLGLFVGTRLPSPAPELKPERVSPVVLAPSPPSPPAVPIAVPESLATSSEACGVVQLSDTEWELSRDALRACQTRRDDLLAQARIVPAFRDGVPTGFKLLSVRTDSLYHQLGLKNGDVIARINGQSLDTPDKALELYSAMSSAKVLDVVVERAGELRRHTYALR